MLDSLSCVCRSKVFNSIDQDVSKMEGAPDIAKLSDLHKFLSRRVSFTIHVQFRLHQRQFYLQASLMTCHSVNCGDGKCSLTERLGCTDILWIVLEGPGVCNGHCAQLGQYRHCEKEG